MCGRGLLAAARRRRRRGPPALHLEVSLDELVHGDLAVVVHVQLVEDDGGAVRGRGAAVAPALAAVLNLKRGNIFINSCMVDMYEYVLQINKSTKSCLGRNNLLRIYRRFF